MSISSGWRPVINERKGFYQHAQLADDRRGWRTRARTALTSQHTAGVSGAERTSWLTGLTGLTDLCSLATSLTTRQRSSNITKQGNVFVSDIFGISPPLKAASAPDSDQAETLTLQTLTRQTLTPIQRRRSTNPRDKSSSSPLFEGRGGASKTPAFILRWKIKARVVICNHEGAAAVAR